MKAPKKFIKFIEEEKNIDEIIDWIMEVSDEEMEEIGRASCRERV